MDLAIPRQWYLFNIALFCFPKRSMLKLWGVVANGRYYDRAMLQRMDPEAFKLAPELLRASAIARS